MILKTHQIHLNQEIKELRQNQAKPMKLLILALKQNCKKFYNGSQKEKSSKETLKISSMSF